MEATEKATPVLRRILLEVFIALLAKCGNKAGVL